MPLVFPWEARRISKLCFNNECVFKPFLVYQYGNLNIIVLYRWIIKNKCIFLTNDNKCKIHGEKPLACKIYPLIINLDDNTLRVSYVCKFISSNKHLLDNTDPALFFKNEYFNALKTFIFLKIIDEYACNNKWRKIIINNTSINKLEYIDIDQYIDVYDLMNSIEKSLSKYSEKPS